MDGSQLGIAPLLSYSTDIRDAAAAEFWVGRILANIRAQMPATHTLGMDGFLHLDGETLYLRVQGPLRPDLQRQDPGGGGDEGKA